MTDRLIIEGTPESGATFSHDRRYRFKLWRRWSDGARPVAFLMLNPSTADASVDDPTIRRCCGFARRWKASGIIVVNLYAWRATKPSNLPPDASAVSPLDYPYECDHAIYGATNEASRIICAWGANVGPVAERGPNVVKHLLPRLRTEALGLTKSGAPRHPLYMPADAAPITYPSL